MDVGRRKGINLYVTSPYLAGPIWVCSSPLLLIMTFPPALHIPARDRPPTRPSNPMHPRAPALLSASNLMLCSLLPSLETSNRIGQRTAMTTATVSLRLQ